MTILRVLKKSEKGVEIYFNSGEKIFLSNEVFFKNGLRKNDDISESRLKSLLEEELIYKLRQKALGYLGRRLHSVHELRIKLKQGHNSITLIDTVLEDLVSKGIIDDVNFARQFAEEKIRKKYWGKNKVRYELINKGITRDIVLKVLNEKIVTEDDVDNAVVLIKKKIKIIRSKNYDELKLRAKLSAYLLSKGYSYETIAAAIEKILKDTDRFSTF